MVEQSCLNKLSFFFNSWEGGGGSWGTYAYGKRHNRTTFKVWGLKAIPRESEGKLEMKHFNHPSLFVLR